MNQCSFVLFYYCSQSRVGHGDKYLPGYLHEAEAPAVSAKMPAVTVYALCGSARTGKPDLINFVSMNYVFIRSNGVLAFAHAPHHSSANTYTGSSARACRHRGKAVVVARPPISEPVQSSHD